MRVQLAALACVALACGVAASAPACPPPCVCGDSEGEREYSCGRVGVKGMSNDFVKITCENVTDLCSELPALPFSSNSTLSSISLYSCPLPPRFECVLHQLGAVDALKVTIDKPRGVLTRDTVRGLEKTTLLMVTGAVNQTTVPYDVLEALPSLSDFRLRGAKLRLRAAGDGDGDGDQPELAPHPSLKYVELSSDGIEQLPRAAFMKLGRLPALHLWANKLMNLRNDSFLGLEHLKELDLSRNPLSSLPKGVFAPTPRVTRLSLVANALSEIGEGVLSGLQHLEKILIKFNTVPLKFGPRALSNLPSLKTLTIDRSKLSDLPPDLLEGDGNILELILTGNSIKEIPKGFFKELAKLELLNLKDNKITALDKDVLRPLKALKDLDLSGNLIEVLPGQLCSGLKNLVTLSMDRNRLRAVSDDALRGATNLRSLTLASNQLTFDDNDESTEAIYSEPLSSPFSSLLHLRSLVLRHNRVSRLRPDWRLVLVQLDVLDLYGNRIYELTKADVQFLAANLTVDLRHNNITTIDVIEAPPWWPEDLPQTTNSTILLDDNPFKCDCELHSFIKRLQGSKPLTAEPKFNVQNAKCNSPPSLKNYPLTKLTSEKLTCNLKDEDCPENCLCDLRPATDALELDCVEIPAKYPIPSEFGMKKMLLKLNKTPDFNKIPDFVVSLNISGVGLTGITEIPDNIKELDLSNNNLSTPPEVILRTITLFLKDNPFICDCNHYEDVFLLQRNMGKIVDYENITCVNGESPWRVNAARLCDFRRAAILGSSLAIFGCIIAVLAAVAYRYSLEIRVFLYSKGICMKLLKEDDLDKEMQYDAFVSFSQKDARWVAEELVPKLENEPNNLKLCVHYRDWLVGDMIPSQIARSVEQSSRTIVVLSKNFLESSWALLEFRAAHLRSQKEKRARVLVVVLDLPSDDSMDAELRAYVSTNTYLKWGDPWFWEKLIYALPHRRNKSVDKLSMGGLQTTLNAYGVIVNGALKESQLPKY